MRSFHLVIGLATVSAMACGDTASGECSSKGAVRLDNGLCECPVDTVKQTSPDRCVPLSASAGDAAVAGDSGAPSSPRDAGHAGSSPQAETERDAGSSGASPPVDAGSVVNAPDGASNAASADAGSAGPNIDGGALLGPDAAVPFPCSPNGTWWIVYSEYGGGTCGSPTPNDEAIEWQFSGTMHSPLEVCQLFPELSGDGCKLEFDQYCPLVSDKNVITHESGSWEMVSPREIVGTSRIERIDPTKGGAVCRSMYNFHAVR